MLKLSLFAPPPKKMTTNPETGYHRTFVNTNVSTTEHVSALLPSHPRGLGLLQLPTGVTDERSGPMMPNIYVAGNKPFNKPQTVPNIHLPGQFASFQGRYATAYGLTTLASFVA